MLRERISGSGSEGNLRAVPRVLQILALFVAAPALCVACSSSAPIGANETSSPPSSSTADSRAAAPEATSTPIPKCDDATTEALVRRFVAEFNVGAIDKVDSLFVSRGAGFRFLSTQKWGVEIDRTRVFPILQEFYQAGERIPDMSFSTVAGAGVDGIGGAGIRYGANGTIKFQIHCKTQLIAAIAWDNAEQPALRR